MADAKTPVKATPPTPQDTPPKTDSFKIPNKDKPSIFHRFKNWYATHKKISIPITILVLLIILGAVPYIRFKVGSLFIKQNFTLQVLDSTAHIPVSGVEVKSGPVSALTDGNGKATLHTKVGRQTIYLSKKYYQSETNKALVPILKPKTTARFDLTATGRQVQVSVTNLINSQNLSNVNIVVAGITGKTDKNGTALLVLPANITSAQATLSAAGYNNSKVKIQVSNTKIEQNKFTLTPTGKVYFLSKLSGTIDVVKTNLDGTDRETVIAGTGKEAETNTVLLASRDWKYLALLSTRDGDQKLYVINTADDKLITMDQGNATFSPVGWYNHYFVYTVYRNGYNSWQANASSIKSYNADNGQMFTLANTNATGSSNYDAIRESFGSILLMGNQVVYSKTWYSYGYSPVTARQNVLASIHPDGTGAQNVKAVDAPAYYISSLKLNKPNELYFGVYSSNGSASTTYWTYNGSDVSQNNNLSDQALFSEADTYLLSPSANQTFWHDERDGKNILFVGDQNGANAKQIANLSAYTTYGWYTDDYLLVSKDSSELFIIPVSGIKSDSQAIKISDYHKPSQNFYGYGGGYGGL